MKKRAFIYIDGFNLYYGAVKDTPYKWLDVVALGKHFLKQYEVMKTKYFTARVTQMGDSDRPTRQQIFWRALKRSYEDDIDIIKGYFRIDPRCLPKAIKGTDKVFRATNEWV
jgi:hypothetical protein